MAAGEVHFRPLAGLQGFHLSDFPTSILLPLCFLSSFLSSPLSPVYRNLCVASLGLLLSSITTLLTGWSSSTISLPHLGSAALTLFLLPPDSRAATYAVYWAVICLQPITRSLVASFPRSFTFGEACIVSQGLLLLVTSVVLNFIALPFWTPSSTFFAISTVSRGILESLEDQRSTVVGLLLFWSILGLLSLAVVPIYHWQQWNVTTRTRKLFHLAVLAVYTTGLAFSPLLLALASIGATLAMLGLEIIRVSRVIPDISSILTTSLKPFLDSKEGGSLILTHIYLLVGASWPLWLAPALNPPSLPLYAGLLSVGVLDTAASVIGSTFGRLHWPDRSGRTVEGSLAGWLSALAYTALLSHLGLVSIHSWVNVGIALAITALVEATCWQVDNLVLPLLTYCLLTIL